MKKACILACMLLCIVSISSCVKGFSSADEQLAEESTTTPKQESSEGDSDDLIINLEPDNPVVLDFAVLPEEDFPRGIWTLNQLIKKYGTPESIIANYWPEPGYQTVDVEILFKNISIRFWPVHVSSFSFYNEVGEPVFASNYEKYELNKNDKEIEFEILMSTFYDTNLEFPYGIQIGKSTKSEVISAYPQDATYPYYGSSGKGDDQIINTVWAYYGFRDENGILPIFKQPIGTNMQYFFDETDVLQSVEITWRLLML